MQTASPPKLNGKPIRFFIRHRDRGLYLGNGCWSNGPEAAAVNNVPTFTGAEVRDLRKLHAVPDGSWTVPVGYEELDMRDFRLSEKRAVELGLVREQWADKGEVA